jgi:tRNA (guanosine-2'-O-)-methyltransferase
VYSFGRRRRVLWSRAVEPDPADVVAALGPLIGAERSARIDAVAAARLGGVAAVLEELHDPHNTGACLRSCEAMGVHQVHLIHGRGRFRTSARITQGCEKWLALERHTDAAECARAVRARGLKLYAAVPGAARSLWQLDPRQPTALAFGNEHTGLSPALRAAADGEFAIPMHGASQSLNVSVSAAVSLAVLSERRRQALGAPGDLDERARTELRARYYALEVRGWRAVVARHLAERRAAPR